LTAADTRERFSTRYRARQLAVAEVTPGDGRISLMEALELTALIALKIAPPRPRWCPLDARYLDENRSAARRRLRSSLAAFHALGGPEPEAASARCAL